MNIKSRKAELIEMLIATSDENLLDEVTKVFKKARLGISSNSQAKIDSIKRGLKDIEEGRVHSHNAVRKLYAKWL